jgi:hypothetical protein
MESRWRGIPGVTLASVGGGAGPCQRTPGGGGRRLDQAIGDPGMPGLFDAPPPGSLRSQ